MNGDQFYNLGIVFILFFFLSKEIIVYREKPLHKPYSIELRTLSPIIS